MTDNQKPVYTQEQQEAMVAFIRKLLHPELVQDARIFATYDNLDTSAQFKLIATIQEIIDMAALLSAIDTAATPLPDSGNAARRYVLAPNVNGFGSVFATASIIDTVANKYIVEDIPFPLAETITNNLNTENEV